MVPHQYLIMASRDYLTIINIHRYLARLPVPTVLRVACASQWTRRPGAEEGGNRERAERGAGGQDIASHSGSWHIEALLTDAGAEPTPRGGGGGGGGIAISVFTSISPVSHQYLTSISPVSHQYLTSIISRVSHQYLTIISPVSHQYLTSISPVSHQYLTAWCRQYSPVSPSPVLSQHYLAVLSHHYLTIIIISSSCHHYFAVSHHYVCSNASKYGLAAQHSGAAARHSGAAFKAPPPESFLILPSGTLWDVTVLWAADRPRW